MIQKRALLGASLAASLVPLAVRSARAQGGYPDRPIKLVVGYAPGGGVDIVARLVGEAMRSALGQVPIVENRPGASAMIGAQTVARAPADGYTLLMAAAGEIAANPALLKGKMPYDPARDLVPVSLVATVPNVLVAAPNVPVRDPATLVAYAKANPGKLSYASSGIGNPQHLAGELLNRMAGIDLLHVPYRGAAPALTDVASGRVTLNFSSLGPALPLIRDGKLRAIGVTSKERMPQLPDCPSLSEGPGLEGYELLNWFGLFAPARTPEPVVARLGSAVAAALRDPGLRAKLEEQGAIPRAMPAAEFRPFVAEETRRFTHIIEEAGITAEL
ncbi:Bug family tripartite tricarboxylate transporter substrate binding protein [Roseomonas populi]|uniref:Tripartite tricarboxylate transporter substrate binding protein n=1 Tax=Roseomonas populi TaxID=3121582 RepID=A0ABT1X4L5_9PROT|nr:tripartite tricarboxylate transporter substrate binding protein [Roseomonas pecuniae]MCR0982659.1 tripartite tricarboxylate transporter substrate binding protein [Roseomonas pecuniae]